jgi:rRNA maturation endonuclease Nob1
MALITCSECRTEISDQALVCPKCGAPKIALPPKKKKSAIGSLLWALAIVAAIGIAISSGGPSGSDGTARPTRWKPSAKEIADQPEREKLIAKLATAGLWSKVEKCEIIDVCIFVRGAFYGLDFQEKQNYVRLIWSYYSISNNSDVLTIQIKDAKSGKKIGTYERHKLTMF